jgi:hypothetical protein
MNENHGNKEEEIVQREHGREEITKAMDKRNLAVEDAQNRQL